MKNCINKDCFWARTADEILRLTPEGLVAQKIRTMGVCDSKECPKFIGINPKNKS